MVVDALRNDPSFNSDTVTRLWIATASRYDDSGEPTPHDTDQLMLEWKGGVQSLSPEVLAAICEVNPWGKIRGAHSELESAPWLLNMLQLNNLIHKVSQSLEGRGLASGTPCGQGMMLMDPRVSRVTRKRHTPPLLSKLAMASLFPRASQVSLASVLHVLIPRALRHLLELSPTVPLFPRTPSHN